MRTYKYKAKDEAGSLITGEVEASGEYHAARLVRQQGLVVVSINLKREIPINLIKTLKERVTGGDLTNFTRRLATMMNAGLPLTEALLILRTQSRTSMQKIVSQILADVEEGEALSSAMRKHPSAFSKTYIALVKSGEVGGVVEKVLIELANNLEKQQEFKGKVKGALIYPVIIVVGMIAVALIMLIFVIPRLLTLYEQFEAELPLATRILMGVSDIFGRFWLLFIIGIGVGIYAMKAYRTTKKGRRKTDEILFKIPLIGDLQKQIILTDLTRTLSLMISSGVPILEGLSIGSQVVKNSVISDALDDARKMVEKGFPLAFAFSRHPDAFPFIVPQMIAVGEETGKMDEVLAKLSHVFEVESEQKVKVITSAVEPIILIILGVGVAFLVISIILPIYNLTTQL